MKPNPKTLGAVAALGLAASAAALGHSETNPPTEGSDAVDRPNTESNVQHTKTLSWDEALAEIRRRAANDLRPIETQPKPETDSAPDEPEVTEPDTQDDLAAIPWHGAYLADLLLRPDTGLQAADLESTHDQLEKEAKQFALMHQRPLSDVMDEANSRLTAIQRSKDLPTELDLKLTLLTSGPEIAFQDAFDQGQFETAVRLALMSTRSNPQSLSELLTLFEKDLDTNAGLKIIDFGRALDLMPPYLRHGFMDMLTRALNELTLNESQAGAINLIFDAINGGKAG